MRLQASMFLYFSDFDVSFIVLSQTVDRNSLLEEEVKIVPPNEEPSISEKVFRSYTTAFIAMARVSYRLVAKVSTLRHCNPILATKGYF